MLEWLAGLCSEPAGAAAVWTDIAFATFQGHTSDLSAAITGAAPYRKPHFTAGNGAEGWQEITCHAYIIAARKIIR